MINARVAACSVSSTKISRGRGWSVSAEFIKFKISLYIYKDETKTANRPAFVSFLQLSAIQKIGSEAIEEGGGVVSLFHKRLSRGAQR